MYTVKVNFDSTNGLAFAEDTIQTSNLNSHVIVPYSNSAAMSFQDKLNTYLPTNTSYLDWWTNLNATEARIETLVADNLETVNQQVSTLTGTVSGNSTDLAAVVTQFGTFKDQAESAAWYGVSLNTDGLISGFEVGSLVGGGAQESYFKIAADSFIVTRSYEVGSDEYINDPTGLGYATMIDDLGDPLPAFSIDWNGTTYDTVFNGKVTINGMPEQANKFIGAFADESAVSAFLAANPNIELTEGDTYQNTTDGKMYTYIGGNWVSLTGADGIRGTVVGFTISDDTTTYQSIIEEVTGVPGLIKGDQVVVSSPTVGSYISTWDGAAWVNNTALTVNGDAVINGTLAVSRLNNDLGWQTASDVGSTILGYGYTTLSDVQAQGYVLPSGVASAINNNATTINGSKITTGTLNAAHISTGRLEGINAYFNGAYRYSTDGYSWSVAAGGGQGGGHFQGSSYGVVGKTSGGGVGAHGYGGSIGVHGVGSSYGVQGQGGNVGVYGTGSTWGLYTPNDAGIGGTAYPFTAGHIGFTLDKVELGDIVYVSYVKPINLSNSFTELAVTTTAKDKRAFGICKRLSYDIDSYMESFPELYDETGKVKDEFKYNEELLRTNGYEVVLTNSIGEGSMNVCNEGGNIEAGDYICSSSTPGKGMKQPDDLLHNYTVAKALEAAVWDGAGAEIKQIAVTYHCG